MNILVTSAGRRVKIIEYFKEILAQENGKVIATDCDINAPAIYFANEFEIVPKIDEPNYIDTLINICKKHKITAVLSLIDPELELLAENKLNFDKLNIKLILSPLEFIKIAFDKYETFNYLNTRAISTVPTYNNIEAVKGLVDSGDIKFPLVVKPAKGSASLGLYVVENENELKEAFNKYENQIVQPFYKDKEFGIDVYIDMLNGRLVDMFIKEKVRMRAGETDKSISIHNDKVELLVEKLIKETNFIGPIDIDCFEYQGEYYISEINPRFGGGYPHAYEMGINFMEYIMHNLKGYENKQYTGINYEKEIIMMKYDNIKLMNKSQENKKD